MHWVQLFYVVLMVVALLMLWRATYLFFKPSVVSMFEHLGLVFQDRKGNSGTFRTQIDGHHTLLTFEDPMEVNAYLMITIDVRELISDKACWLVASVCGPELRRQLCECSSKSVENTCSLSLNVVDILAHFFDEVKSVEALHVSVERGYLYIKHTQVKHATFGEIEVQAILVMVRALLRDWTALAHKEHHHMYFAQRLEHAQEWPWLKPLLRALTLTSSDSFYTHQNFLRHLCQEGTPEQRIFAQVCLNDEEGWPGDPLDLMVRRCNECVFLTDPDAAQRVAVELYAQYGKTMLFDARIDVCVRELVVAEHEKLVGCARFIHDIKEYIQQRASHGETHGETHGEIHGEMVFFVDAALKRGAQFDAQELGFLLDIVDELHMTPILAQMWAVRDASFDCIVLDRLEKTFHPTTVFVCARYFEKVGVSPKILRALDVKTSLLHVHADKEFRAILARLRGSLEDRVLGGLTLSVDAGAQGGVSCVDGTGFKGALEKVNHTSTHELRCKEELMFDFEHEESELVEQELLEQARFLASHEHK